MKISTSSEHHRIRPHLKQRTSSNIMAIEPDLDVEEKSAKSRRPRRERNNGVFVISKIHMLAILGTCVIFIMSAILAVYFLVNKPSCNADEPIPIPDPSIKSASIENYRLPRNVLPAHYNIRLLPLLNENNSTIAGRVEIDIVCYQETDNIVLHAANISVDATSVEVIEHTGKKLKLGGIEFDTDREFLIIRLCPIHRVKLTQGLNYTLSMSFSSQLTDAMKGFYRTPYMEDFVQKNIAVTQMEPTDARRVFPCFDEPNMKAVFSVTLGRHRSMTALSNMPLINSSKIEGMSDYYWDKFAPSVPMSTYLVGFAVGNFTKIEGISHEHDAWQLNIYVRPSAANQTEYAKDIGPRIQSFYENFFNITFPLPKQDMVAVRDFPFEGMENWGLVVYSEAGLLYDQQVSSINDKQYVLELVAHELAHQWFGNLVTMDWWTDLWLNEGFANYIQYIGAQHVDPAFEMLQQVVTNEVQNVMETDCLESSHPISQVVNNPNEIAEIFDLISYKKGASIIRMLANFIGQKTFRRGLSNYLKSKEYGNAVQDDLWLAFTEQSEIDQVVLPASVKQIMDSWTLKMGYPVVTVTRDYQATDAVSVRQERFALRKSDSKDDISYLWWVPLTYMTSIARGSSWMSDSQAEIEDLRLNTTVMEDEWLLFNVEEMGYYRVNYDLQNWRLLIKQLMSNPSTIPTINRAQILDDAFNLARAGLLDYSIPLKLTLYLNREQDYLPWQSTLNALDYLSTMLSRSANYGQFKKYAENVVKPLYQLVGFDPQWSDTHLTIKKRFLATKWACYTENKDCVDNSIDSYHQWMGNPEDHTIITPDMKEVVTCTAIRHGGQEEWDFAFNRYNSSNVASEQLALLSALSCSRQPWLLARMLDWTLNSSSGIRQQDASFVIHHVAKNDLGRYMAFYFIRERWEEVKSFFVTFNSLLDVVQLVTESFNTELELKELKKFRDEHEEVLMAAGARSTQQFVERVENNVNWMRLHYHKVTDWLMRQNL